MNVYDFDGTIYQGDSSVDFYLFMLRKSPLLIRYLPIQAGGMLLYLLGIWDKTRCKQAFFRFLRGTDAAEYLETFWTGREDRIAAWYKEQKQESDVIISASPAFLLRPILRKLGVQGLIASQVDEKSGVFLSPNCRGAEKARRFLAAFPHSPIDCFYSDNQSDKPIAQLADKAYLVDRGKISPWPHS